MTHEQQGLLQRLRRFLSPSEELEAEDLKERSRDCGASPLSECCERSKVKLRGTVRWVTSLDMGGVEALLTDCDLVVQGRISSGDDGLVMYNPEFEVVS